MSEQIYALTDDQLDLVSGGEIKLSNEKPHASSNSTGGTTAGGTGGKPPRGPLRDVGVEGVIQTW